MRRALATSLMVLAPLGVALALVVAPAGTAVRAGAATRAGAPASGPAPSRASRPPIRGAVTVEFKAHAAPDFEVTLYGYVDRVELRIERGSETGRMHQIATYSVPGTVGEGGVKARWGSLGDVAMAFTPDTPSGRIPHHDCHSRSFIVHGAYDGHLRFKGESGYVTVDLAHTAGEMRFDRGLCPGEGERAAPPATAAAPGISLLPLQDLRRPGREEFVGLDAIDRRASVIFQAQSIREVQDAHRSNRFRASVNESRGEVTIGRESEAPGAAPSAFVYDLRRGVAQVRPPAPFIGSAVFHGRAEGRRRWSGSLRVPLLGGGTIALTGPGFRTSLEEGGPVT